MVLFSERSREFLGIPAGDEPEQAFRISGLNFERTVAATQFQNRLAQNYPNPFNPTTTIAFSLAEPGHVDLRVYDVKGALVRTLVNEGREANNYRVLWDGTSNSGSGVSTGVYFYRLRAEGFAMTKKMVLLK